MNLIQSIIAPKFIVLLIFTGLFPSLGFAAESQYATGHGALNVFNGEGFLSTPTWVQGWLVLLLGTFIVGFYFSWKHPLARWAVVGLILSMTMGHTVFELLNLPFLGGSIAIMHIVCWSPTLLVLLLKRPFLNENEKLSFRIWSSLMVSVLMFSFFFDIRDAIIYINHFS